MLNPKSQFLKPDTNGYIYQNEISCDYPFTDNVAYVRLSFDNISQIPANVYLKILLGTANR